MSKHAGGVASNGVGTSSAHNFGLEGKGADTHTHTHNQTQTHTHIQRINMLKPKKIKNKIKPNKKQERRCTSIAIGEPAGVMLSERSSVGKPLPAQSPA